MERWAGKVAVVTGASAGIGQAIVKELAAKGMVVVGLARREDNIKELTRSSKGTIHAVKCDIAKEEDIINAFRWIASNVGGVDLLVNNAGTFPLTTFSDGLTTDWKQTFDVNVIGSSICTREGLKTMRKRGDNGHIILVNSVLGHADFNIPKSSMYCASKYAVTSLAQSLRNELKSLDSSIKVTSLSPGGVHTTMVIEVCKAVYGLDVALLTEPRPNGQLSSEDIADAVISIISMKPHVQVEEYTVQAIK